MNKNISVKVGIISNPKNKVVGMATVQIGSIVLGNIRIIQGKDNLFIGFPSYKKSNGDYKDIFYIANQEKRDQFQKMVIDEYNNQLKNVDMTPVDDGDIPF